MKRIKLSIFAALLFSLLFAVSVIAADSDSASDTALNGEVVIYHTNDTHGYIGSGDGYVTIDKIATLKATTENSILVDAGDATQGAPLASLTMGADIIDIMNLAGYDLMVPGNHEFDFGTEQFLSNVSLADFPVLAANVYLDDSLLLEGVQDGNNGCHTIIEEDGIKVGFFGLTTSGTATSTNPEGIPGLKFADEVETAIAEIEELIADGADVIIAVCHLGDSYGGAPCTSEDLAQVLAEAGYADYLNAIIDGHSHTVEDYEVDGILIVQTGSNCSAIGKLTVTVRDGEVSLTEELLTADDLADIESDAAVLAKLEEIQASQSVLLEEELGEIATSLWGGTVGYVAVARIEETNYGNLASDAIKAAAESFIAATGTNEEQTYPVIAVENGGGIRATVSNGTVTNEDLVTTFPYSNTVYIKIITPAMLYDIMEASGSLLDGQDENGTLLQSTNSGSFLQISGFTVVFDTEAEEGSRVVSITLDGQSEPLDRDDDTTQIFLAGNNYILAGGGSYSMLADVDLYGEGGGELEAVTSYLLSCIADGSISDYYGTQGRIQFTSSTYNLEDYTVKILITDEDGNTLANCELSYRVDGGECINGVTDSEGYLYITLSVGGHGIALGTVADEVYVSNYSGFGLIEDTYRTIPSLVFYADGSSTDTSSSETGDNQSKNQILILIASGCVCAVMLAVTTRKRFAEK